MVKILLNKADASFVVTVMSTHGTDEMLHAIQNKHFEMLKLLLENANKGFTLGGVDSEGRDGLMIAILQNNMKLV